MAGVEYFGSLFNRGDILWSLYNRVGYFEVIL